MRTVPSFEFMHWAKQRVGAVPYCLGNSGVPAVDPEDFPPAPAPYAEANYYGTAAVREAIARAHGVSPDRVLLSDGTSLANYTALTALAGPGDRVLVENPTYPILREIPRFHGAAVDSWERAPERDWVPDLAEVERAAGRPGPPLRGAVLSRLHKPSGATVPEDFLRDLAKLAERHDLHVLVDEVFLDMLPDAVPAHRLSRRFLSTGSLTKVYGFGALRCGWILGDEDVLHPLKELSFYLSVDGAAVSQATAVRVFQRRDEFLERARGIGAAGMSVLTDWVESRDDVTWRPPAAGINAFLDLSGVDDTRALADRLFREYGVTVAPGEYFGRSGGVRVSVGGKTEAVRGALARLEEALSAASGRK